MPWRTFVRQLNSTWKSFLRAKSAGRSYPFSRLILPRLPRVSGAQAIRALERLGFVQARQRGSHVVMRRIDPDTTTGCVVPLHSELAIGTLRGIVKQAGIKVEEFIQKL